MLKYVPVKIHFEHTAARSFDRHFICRVRSRFASASEQKPESNRRIYFGFALDETTQGGTLINKSFHAHLITTRANTKNSLLFRRDRTGARNIKPSRIYIALIGPAADKHRIEQIFRQNK